MAANRTFSIIKPDAVAKNVIGPITAKLEQAGLRVLASKMVRLTDAQAKAFYAVHKDRPFYGDLVTFIVRAPVFAMVVEGPDENTYLLVRKVVGATKVEDAEPGSIRGDYATMIDENVVHGSDAPATAEREIQIFFERGELLP